MQIEHIEKELTKVIQAIELLTGRRASDLIYVKEQIISYLKAQRKFVPGERVRIAHDNFNNLEATHGWHHLKQDIRKGATCVVKEVGVSSGRLGYLVEPEKCTYIAYSGERLPCHTPYNLYLREEDLEAIEIYG